MTGSPGAELRSVRNAAVLLSAALVLGLIALTGPVTVVDGEAETAFRLLRAGWLDGFCRLVSAGVVPAAVVGALLAVAVLRHRRPLVWRVLALTFGGWVLAVAVQPMIDRPRPPRSGWLTEAIGGSYPSTHVALAAGAALAGYAIGGRSRYRTLVLAAGVAAVLAVALSRLYLGVHHPTDVIGALLLCGAAAALVGWVPPGPSSMTFPHQQCPPARS